MFQMVRLLLLVLSLIHRAYGDIQRSHSLPLSTRQQNNNLRERRDKHGVLRTSASSSLFDLPPHVDPDYDTGIFNFTLGRRGDTTVSQYAGLLQQHFPTAFKRASEFLASATQSKFTIPSFVKHNHPLTYRQINIDLPRIQGITNNQPMHRAISTILFTLAKLSGGEYSQLFSNLASHLLHFGTTYQSALVLGTFAQTPYIRSAHHHSHMTMVSELVWERVPSSLKTETMREALVAFLPQWYQMILTQHASHPLSKEFLDVFFRMGANDQALVHVIVSVLKCVEGKLKPMVREKDGERLLMYFSKELVTSLNADPLVFRRVAQQGQQQRRRSIFPFRRPTP